MSKRKLITNRDDIQFMIISEDIKKRFIWKLPVECFSQFVDSFLNDYLPHIMNERDLISFKLISYRPLLKELSFHALTFYQYSYSVVIFSLSKSSFINIIFSDVSVIVGKNEALN